MCQHSTKHPAVAHLLCAAGVAVAAVAVSASPAAAQIYLNPIQQNMTRSRVSIDMGDGLRCTSDGGSVPTLSLSMGAYPDQLGSDNTFYDRSTVSQSSLLGLVSVHVPLDGTSQKFDCNALLKDAKIRARLDNLRELVDENIISDEQYRAAVRQLYQPILEPTQNKEDSTELSGAGKRGSLRLSGRAEPPRRLTEVVATSGDAEPVGIASAGPASLSSPPPLPPLPDAVTTPPLNRMRDAPAIAASE